MEAAPPLKVCCMGSGYVGGCTMAVMALKCEQVQATCIDVDKAKVDAWNSSVLPVYEPGLLEVVQEVRGTRLFFRHAVDAEEVIRESDIIFVCVPTPTKQHGIGEGMASDLTYWEQAAREIASALSTCPDAKPRVVVEKSTVPVHTAEAVTQVLEAADVSNVTVVSNPEFLAEGTAIADLLLPDRVLIGGPATPEGARAVDVLARVYQRWIPPDRVCRTNVWSAELAKIIANAMLAQRVSSINATAQICEATGADVGEVARIVGMDSRIGPRFLQPSLGFGGSCFQKDLLNLIYMCRSKGLAEVARYWQGVLEINDLQRTRFVARVVSTMFNTLRGKKIALFGFAFKANTADTRESSSIYVARALLAERCLLCVQDPHVDPEVMRREVDPAGVGGGVDELLTCCRDPYEAAAGADAVLVCTEWAEYRALDYRRILAGMRRPAHLFDGRRLLDAGELAALGFRVHVIGSAEAGPPADQPATASP